MFVAVDDNVMTVFDINDFISCDVLIVDVLDVEIKKSECVTYCGKVYNIYNRLKIKV